MNERGTCELQASCLRGVSSLALKRKQRVSLAHACAQARVGARVGECVHVRRARGGRGRRTRGVGEDVKLPCRCPGEQALDTLSCWREPRSWPQRLPFQQKWPQSCYCFPQVTNATGLGAKPPGAQLLPRVSKEKGALFSLSHLLFGKTLFDYGVFWVTFP